MKREVGSRRRMQEAEQKRIAKWIDEWAFIKTAFLYVAAYKLY